MAHPILITDGNEELRRFIAVILEEEEYSVEEELDSRFNDEIGGTDDCRLRNRKPAKYADRFQRH